jgi:hypothetical protein
MKHILLILFVLATAFSCRTIPSDQNLIESLLRRDPKKFDEILKYKDRYEIQIIYTQIDRDQNNLPHFTSFSYNFDSTRYFYPASTVKLPLVLLSLEKLRLLGIEGLDRTTTMFHDSLYSGQMSVRRDSTSENGFPSVEHYSKKILVVSDNDAFNRLYEFMGQQATNNILHAKGFTSVRIVHRLERPLNRDQNRHTEAVSFTNGNSVVYAQPMLVNPELIEVPLKILKGKGFVRNDSLIQKPFDFTYKNFLPLHSQQEIVKSIIFPQAVAEAKRFKISEDDRRFVLQYMSQLPRETRFPPYFRDTAYYDAYCKFLLFGADRGTIPEHIRMFNKVGDAYGYLIDNAYVVDFKNKIEFMLSAVIHTNADSVYNDGKYEYQSTGYPFMRDLGQAVYRYELKRKRKFKPDLTALRLTYDIP